VTEQHVNIFITNAVPYVGANGRYTVPHSGDRRIVDAV
jgi:hypothetical protein